MVVRIKDRISEPLDSGYRDVLLNLRIKGIGCDMIMELQLHLRDIIKLKEAGHRTYDFLRTLGWEVSHAKVNN